MMVANVSSVHVIDLNIPTIAVLDLIKSGTPHNLAALFTLIFLHILPHNVPLFFCLKDGAYSYQQ
jgi:hypothetical protein